MAMFLFLTCIYFHGCFSKKYTLRRIVYSLAKIEIYPYHAIIYNSKNPSEFCSGAIINNRWIISTRKCVDWNDHLSRKIAVGVDDVNKSAVATINGTYFLMKFSQLVLFRLEKSLDFNDKVKAISLASLEEGMQVQGSIYQNMWVTTFGYRQEVRKSWHDSTTPPRHMENKLKVIQASLSLDCLKKDTREKCIKCIKYQYETDDKPKDGTDHECIVGDGSPMVSKKKNNTYVLLGIKNTNFYHCPYDDYTIVSDYIKQIQDIIGRNYDS